MAQLSLPSPTPWQANWLRSGARYKVLPAGRRSGKSRGFLVGSIAGHGAGLYGDKQYKGVVEGRDVVWFAQDYPNLKITVWNEEIERRFKDKPYCKINENDMQVEFLPTSKHPNGASLYLRSAEAIAGVRGIGKYLGGVIIDEAAHLDLRDALLNIVLPACLDNGAWLMLGSTTNAGLDGNSDKVVPSYFNRICDEIEGGGRSQDWAMFEGTAWDNPTLSRPAIQAWIDEYDDGSIEKEQEVYARRLKAGGGAALRELKRSVHIIDGFQIPKYWRRWGSFDWGFDHPWVFGEFVNDEDGNVYLIESCMGRGDLPDAIADTIKAQCSPLLCESIHCGHDTWHERKQILENTPTIAEALQDNGFFSLTKASIDRVAGLNNMRKYIAWRGRDGQPDRAPKFRIFDTPNNQRIYAGLERAVLDPKEPEKPLIVNAKNGKGGDDEFTMVRYGLAARPLEVRQPETEELEDINDRSVLASEHARLYRAGRVRVPVGAPTRAPSEMDPDYGEY